MLTNGEPNQPVTLEKTDITQIDGQSADVPVNVIFQLFPFPTVVIESDTLPGILLSKERFEIKLGNGAGLEVMVRSFNIGTGEGSLIPARQPLDVIDKGVPLRSVQFSVLNLPELYGNKSLWVSDGRGSTAIPHAKFETANWCIEITGVPEISTIVKSLRREKGFGLTYNGIIASSDGADFPVEEVRAPLEALRMFLSFARGGYCGLALVEGKDQYGEQAWVRWGAHWVSELDNRSSWLERVGGDDILSGLFPKFLCLFESKNGWKDTTVRTIDWYLQSNESPPHVGLILTLAALERLSFQVLERERDRKRREPTGKFIEKALVKLNIEPNLPNSCEKLRQVKNWKHGPHAVVEIRNDLIHPNLTLAGVSDHAIHEAWNLGQWYIEMMLLRKLEYQGSYVNRLAGWREHDQTVLPVPWVKKP